MDLPLFKGIGADNLSLLLEKTSVEFLNYKAGEHIFTSNEIVKSLDFIIKGKVEISYMIQGYDIRLKEILGSGNVLGATRLYGIEPRYCADIMAHEPSSIIRISKEQYVKILRSDEIYLINYLNYLSAAAQRPQNYLLQSLSPSEGHISNQLGLIIKTTVCHSAEKIIIEGSDDDMAKILGVTVTTWQQWKNDTCEQKIISIEADKLIISKENKEV